MCLGTWHRRSQAGFGAARLADILAGESPANRGFQSLLEGNQGGELGSVGEDWLVIAPTRGLCVWLS